MKAIEKLKAHAEQLSTALGRGYSVHADYTWTSGCDEHVNICVFRDEELIQRSGATYARLDGRTLDEAVDAAIAAVPVVPRDNPCTSVAPVCEAIAGAEEMVGT